MSSTPNPAAAAMDAWMAPFAPGFSRPVWRRVLVLVAGAILAHGRRTVASALRAAGLEGAPDFAAYHRVLSRARRSSRDAARVLLALLLGAFAPTGPVVVALDDTLERRWGAKIAARGIYRDPVRSSRGRFVKASGLRWLSLMLLAPVPWAGRVWALPVLTALAPSERHAHRAGRRHKKLTDWARQAVLQLACWLPGRRLVAVGDSGCAALDCLGAVRHRACIVARLRLDARLFAPPPPRTPRTVGRPRVVGRRLPTFAQRRHAPETPWRRLTAAGWHGGDAREVEVASGTAVWHHPGRPVVPLRRGLVRDPGGEFRPPGPAVHGCRRGRRGRAAVVRAALGRRGRLRRDETASRGRDAAAVVGQRYRPHHACAARAVLARGAVGGRAGEGGRDPAAPFRLAQSRAVPAGTERMPRPSATRSRPCGARCGPASVSAGQRRTGTRSKCRAPCSTG